MNLTYREYQYPLNLLIDVCGAKNVPDHSGQGFQSVLNEVLDTLQESERQALSLRYEQHLTFREIGAQMGFSEAWANQVVSKGLRKLRHPTRYQRILGIKLEPAPVPSPSKEMPIGALGLRVNPYYCLLRHGLGAAEDILKLTPEELISMKGIGEKSYQQIVERLAAFGYDVSAYKC